MMRMMIFCSLAVLAIVLLLVLRGGQAGTAVQVPDAGGLRILSTVTAADHILAELDCKEKIAAIDRHGKVLDSMQDVPAAAAGSSVSREFLKKERINCAIIWYYQRDLQELLRKENIYTIIVQPLTLENYPGLIQQLGQLCNKEEAAAALAERYTQSWQTLPETAAAQKVYFELYAPWKTLDSNGFTASLLTRCGGDLCVKASRHGTVSPEAVCQAAPEVIFYVEGFGSARELADRAALRHTPAVENKRIYAVPRYLLCEGVAPDELIKFFCEKLSDKKGN